MQGRLRLHSRRPPRGGGLTWRERLLVGNAAGRALYFRAALRRVRRRTHGHYPAPERILAALRTGLSDGEAAALESEARHFAELALGPVSRRLVQLFLATRPSTASTSSQSSERRSGSSSADPILSTVSDSGTGRASELGKSTNGSSSFVWLLNSGIRRLVKPPPRVV